MKRIVFILLMLAAQQLAALEVQNSGETDSILASVNGEALTLLDVLPLTMPRETQLRAVYSGKLLEKEILSLRKKTVDMLIDHKLVQAEYLKQSFRISNSDIEKELDRVAENMGCRSRQEWIARLRKDGLTLEQVGKEVEKNMMVQVMIQRQIYIDGEPSPGEMYAYFKANEKKYSEPEKVGLAILKLVSTGSDFDRTVEKVSAELKKDGADFAAVVKKYTPDAGDGNIGEIERQLLRPEFSAALQEIIVGKITGPIRLDGEVVWLKVVSHRNVVPADFKNAESRIRKDLEKVRRERVLKDYSRKLRSGALVEYYF